MIDFNMMFNVLTPLIFNLTFLMEKNAL